MYAYPERYWLTLRWKLESEDVSNILDVVQRLKLQPTALQNGCLRLQVSTSETIYSGGPFRADLPLTFSLDAGDRSFLQNAEDICLRR